MRFGRWALPTIAPYGARTFLSQAKTWQRPSLRLVEQLIVTLFGTSIELEPDLQLWVKPASIQNRKRDRHLFDLSWRHG
jgi:hypothetical protein